MSAENNIFGVLTGVLIGASLGVLFAPNKGTKTRKKISKGALNAKETILSEANNIKNEALKKAEDFKKNTLEEKLEHIITDVSYKTDDIITNLEEKLKILKEKNKKLQTKEHIV